MRYLLGLVALLSFCLTPLVRAQSPGAERPNLKHYSLGKAQLALDGYDPVAYFDVGGGAPKRGDKAIEAQHRGVRYRFASELHREIFLAAPERFEPSYGGWCAWAMADGSKTEVDPKSFLIENGRLLVFYDGLFGDTRKSWLKAERNTLHPKADRAWSKLTAESQPHALYTHAHDQGVALDGADPLALLRGELVMGDPRYAVHHGGLTYHLTSAEARAQFTAKPITAQFGGWSPASLAAATPVPGKAGHTIVDGESLILFATAEDAANWTTSRATIEPAAEAAWQRIVTPR
ncbi:MAG: hypothetical protein GC161_07805 [Planctomycetaceae bacterium]|nr:hypothetical protein [Planctomycetaceae bacterium]